MREEKIKTQEIGKILTVEQIALKKTTQDEVVFETKIRVRGEVYSTLIFMAIGRNLVEFIQPDSYQTWLNGFMPFIQTELRELVTQEIKREQLDLYRLVYNRRLENFKIEMYDDTILGNFILETYTRQKSYKIKKAFLFAIEERIATTRFGLFYN